MRLCVFLGSRTGASDVYGDAVETLGRTLAAAHIGLVYGGASIGLMGRLATAVLDAGGSVIGVMPKGLLDREHLRADLTELHVTDSMHERKAMMADLSDGFIAVPGGLGTLEELFEIWTWRQLNFHQKPIGLLNVNRFFDKLLGFTDFLIDEGFILRSDRDQLIVEEDPGNMIAAMTASVSQKA